MTTVNLKVFVTGVVIKVNITSPLPRFLALSVTANDMPSFNFPWTISTPLMRFGRSLETSLNPIVTAIDTIV